MTVPALDELDRMGDWTSICAVVDSFTEAGAAAADSLQHLGARVIVDDRRERAELDTERVDLLEVLGVEMRLGSDSSATVPEDVDVVVASTDTDTALVQAALSQGLPVWGEAELAWRLRRDDDAPWLVVAGSAAETTDIVRILEAVLNAAGRRVAVAGVGHRALVEVVMDDDRPADVVIAQTAVADLRRVASMSPIASVVVTGGEDDEILFARAYENTQLACVYPVENESIMRMVEQADVVEGCRAIGVTVAIPAPSELGVVEDVLADRAFVKERISNAAELARMSDLGDDPTPQFVLRVLTAAALARAVGVEPLAVRDGLRVLNGPTRDEYAGHKG